MQSVILKPIRPVQYTPANPTLKALFGQVQHHVKQYEFDRVVDLLNCARHNPAYAKCKVNWDQLIAHHQQFI